MNSALPLAEQSGLAETTDDQPLSRNAGERLTVIIPNWNGLELLRPCLLSLRRQTIVPSLLVVDNGSKDGSPQMLEREFPEVTVVALSENLGFAGAVNLGIRNSSTAFLALLNNDTEVDPNWVQEGLHALNCFPEYGFFASKIINFYHRDFLDSAGDGYSRTGMPFKRGWGTPPQSFTLFEPVLAASAGAAFYRREIFDQVGFFDESFYMYLEDVEWSLRAQMKGIPCLFLPRAVVYHMEAASDPERKRNGDRMVGAPSPGQASSPPLAYYSPSRVYWITRNRWLLMVMYQPVRNLPWLLYGWSRSLLFHLFKGGFVFSFLRGLVSGMRGTPRALGKRRTLGRTARVPVHRLCQLSRAS